MRKTYIKPTAEILSISASEEFLIGSPDEYVGGATVGDNLVKDDNANEWE